MTAYATLPSYPGYGIYQDGVIRRLRDDKEMLPHNVVTLWVRGRAVTVDPGWLRALAWGDDSATDAPAPAPAVEAPLLSDTAPDAAGDAGEWRPVPGIVGYEISRQGMVRNRRTHRVSKLSTHPGNPNIPCFKTRQLNVLLEEAYGPGAAQVAGLPAPDMQRVARGRASTGKKEWAACVQDKAVLKRGQRRCTTCGKPTINYRCHACWRALRGFGASCAQDDGMEI